MLPKPTLDAPLDIYWSVTQGCNFECSFCFTSSGPGTTQDDLSRDQRAQVLDMIVGSGALRVILTGGEPFVVPEIMDIVAALRGAGIAVKITTNGALLREDTVAQLAALGVRLQFSIEHHDPRLNDLMMGTRESREKVLSGLARARAAGIPCEVKITLQDGNVRDLPGLFEMLAAYGVERIDCSELVPLGRAAERWEEHQASLEDLLAAEGAAAEARQGGLRIDFSSSRLNNQRTNVPARCSLGSQRPRTVLIDERGDMRPCAASQSFGWKNPVLEHGLVGAWDRLVELGQFRDADRLEGECRTCDLVDECKGGCRGVAYTVWGHHNGPDPYCPRIGAREGRRFFGRRVAPVTLVFPDGTVEAPQDALEGHPSRVGLDGR